MPCAASRHAAWACTYADDSFLSILLPLTVMHMVSCVWWYVTARGTTRHLCRYGRGQSEHRVGRHLYDIEPRDSFSLSTKVGRRLVRPRNMALSTTNLPPDPPFPQFAGWAWQQVNGCPKGLKFDHIHDYSYDGIMRSYEDSLQRSAQPTNIAHVHQWPVPTHVVLSRDWRDKQDHGDNSLYDAFDVCVASLCISRWCCGSFLYHTDLA